MIAAVTQPWFFSGERAESISGRSRTLSGASPPKIQKKSGAKKRQFLMYFYVKKLIFCRRRPGALLLDFRMFRVRFLSEGFDPIFHERKREKCEFRGSLT